MFPQASAGPANGAHEPSTFDRFLQDGFYSHVVRFARLQVRKAAYEDHFGRVVTLGQSTVCREILQQKNSVHDRHADIAILSKCRQPWLVVNYQNRSVFESHSAFLLGCV